MYETEAAPAPHMTVGEVLGALGIGVVIVGAILALVIYSMRNGWDE